MPTGEHNYCTACRTDFASVQAFDRHRVGNFPSTGPADYLDRLLAELVPDEQDWRPKHGRRCLEEDEMEAAGMKRVEAGRWTIAR